MGGRSWGELRAGSQGADLALLPGCEGPLAGLWAQELAGGQQTAKLSDVMFSQSDSTACPCALNSVLCAVASGHPHLLAFQACLNLSFPVTTLSQPRDPWLFHPCSASGCDSPAQGMSPCCLCHAALISVLKKDLSARQTCISLLPLLLPGRVTLSRLPYLSEAQLPHL